MAVNVQKQIGRLARFKSYLSSTCPSVRFHRSIDQFSRHILAHFKKDGKEKLKQTIK